MRDGMRMYRDEYYGRGAKWNDDPRDTRKDYRREYDRRGKREDESSSRRVELNKPDELVISQEMLPRDHPLRTKQDDDTAHQGHQLQRSWSKPVTYEEPGTQTKN